MIDAFIGLGSNLENPLRQLEAAVQHLKNITLTNLVKLSGFYKSMPWGPIQDQPIFVNAVAQLSTALDPFKLLEELKNIEHQQGRVAVKERWGPRCIDLDILLYGNEVLVTDNLVIPHPRLGERDFVIYPLLELAPTLSLPQGLSLQQISENCPNRLAPLMQEVL